MISFDKEIFWLVIPVSIISFIFLLILFLSFFEEFSKVDIRGKKY